MHTFTGSNDTLFLYNSDLSGDVRIVRKKDGAELEINGEDILEFVAEYIRMERISKIEQMNFEDILKGD